MNGIEDLRRTLESHAGEAAAPGHSDRGAAVHARIGVVRRRRRAGTAGAVAVVVAVGAGALALPSSEPTAGPTPAGPVVIGLDVPKTLTAAGHEFRLVDTVAGDRATTVLLPGSDRPRLVSWATSGSDDEVVLDGPDSPTTYRAADFSTWVVVDAGSSQRVSATTSEGGVALAVYEPVGGAEVADDLVDGAVTGPGEGPLTAVNEHDGQRWQRFDVERGVGVRDRLVGTVPDGHGEVLVLSAIDTAINGPGVSVREVYGGTDGGLIEVAAGASTSGQGGYVRQPGDRVTLEVTSGEATLTIGYYERVD